MLHGSPCVILRNSAEVAPQSTQNGDMDALRIRCGSAELVPAGAGAPPFPWWSNYIKTVHPAQIDLALLLEVHCFPQSLARATHLVQVFRIERRTETCSVDAGDHVPTIFQRFMELAQIASSVSSVSSVSPGLGFVDESV
jgi:hypothetical protein